MTITHWMGMSKSNCQYTDALIHIRDPLTLWATRVTTSRAQSEHRSWSRSTECNPKQVVSESNTISIQYLYTLFIYITESSTHPPPPPEGYTSSSGPQPASSLCFTA